MLGGQRRNSGNDFDIVMVWQACLMDASINNIIGRAHAVNLPEISKRGVTYNIHGYTVKVYTFWMHLSRSRA